MGPRFIAWQRRDRQLRVRRGQSDRVSVMTVTVIGLLEEYAGQFGTGADAEFAEDFSQVVFDGVRADEQLRGDLRVRFALGDEAGDLRLLGGEVVTGVGGALVNSFAGGA